MGRRDEDEDARSTTPPDEPEHPSIEAAALAAFDPTQIQCLADLCASTSAAFRDLAVGLESAQARLKLLSETIANALASEGAGIQVAEVPSYSSSTSPAPELPDRIHISQLDGITCPQCGGLMQRTGSCMTCGACGHNDGCG